MLAGVAAVASAFFFAVASALQHRAVQTGPVIGGSAKAGMKAMIAIAARPFWLFGVLSDGVGFALQVYALTFGALAVVQPLTATGLLFALPIGALLAGHKLSRSEFFYAMLLVLSLAVFLGLSMPHGGDDEIAVRPAGIIGLCSLVIGAGCLYVARSPEKNRRAAALGVLTGLLFAMSAALIKAVGTQFEDGIMTVLTSWPLYVLIVIGGTGLAVNQVAFQAGPLSASLPAISAVEPLASILLGVVVFGEQLHGGLLGGIVQFFALMAMTVSIVALARSSSQSE